MYTMLDVVFGLVSTVKGNILGVAILVTFVVGLLVFVLFCPVFFFSPHGFAGVGVETLRFGGVDAREGKGDVVFLIREGGSLDRRTVERRRRRGRTKGQIVVTRGKGQRSREKEKGKTN